MPSVYLKTIKTLVFSVFDDYLEYNGVQPSARTSDYDFAYVALIVL